MVAKDTPKQKTHMFWGMIHLGQLFTLSTWILIIYMGKPCKII